MEYVMDRKDSLILTAIEILDEFGIQGLSTREIAKRQGVSEATLFRHYNKKSDLILAMLDFDSKYDSDIMTTVKIKKLKLRAAIIFFINSYAEYYENYPAVTAVSQAYNVLACDPQFAGKVKNAFFAKLCFIQEIIMEAQKAGELSRGIDSESLSYLIWGSFMSICLNWRFNKYNFSLKECTLSTLEMTLDSFEIK
ncbi:TetR family transcriptional regulator [Ruminiclostridium sufflavum DSM 19573]|uniref:TetR family transcriptional regulator n=1 Tax=Ruminiclostridium sufflavum DSM 19573 TaxID=1121337 RepID=A0A318XIR9_9FIRM|nr:TetR/AcrR family transcriptional regulator [Ruminiclostridium sufflavum]PYG84355.1 TetR family transcriptional regulator [Ruminiclostridium sufflavum DSM 19573]